jgi:phospholipid-binding lipoprotein MlaA
VVLALSLAGCASRESLDRMAERDPLEKANRVVYAVNDFGDHYLVRPLAKGYEKITPRILRVGATHFFDNLGYPVVVINDFLQGKFRQGGTDLGRLVMNTSIGLLGVFDPATDVGLVQHDEDLGQTLAVWGMPNGPYLMVPFLGPRTFTHLVGSLGDNIYSPMFRYPDASLRSKLYIYQGLHRRSTLLAVDEEVRKAFDPYVFVRDAYLQNRSYLIHDGNVPDQDLLPEEETSPEAGLKPD